MVDTARYAFRLAQWNELAGVDSFFTLFYFVTNAGRTDIEIIELKHRRKFLARMPYPDLRLSDLRPGVSVVIHSRQYRVLEYEDAATREALGRAAATGSCVVPAPLDFGRALQAAAALGLRLAAARLVALSEEDAAALSGSLAPPGVRAGRAVAATFVGEDAPAKLAQLCETEGALLRAPAPGADAAVERALLAGARADRLPSAREPTAALAECAVVAALPSTLAAGTAPDAVAELLAAVAAAAPPLELTALKTVQMSRAAAEEFLEVYKNVVPDYVELVNEYSSGPMIVMEVCGPDAVPRLRALAGPREPEVARRIRPACVRARFGVTGARPGVHVTDLQEDGPLESENVFYVMDAAPRA